MVDLNTILDARKVVWNQLDFPKDHNLETDFRKIKVDKFNTNFIFTVKLPHTSFSLF